MVSAFTVLARRKQRNRLGCFPYLAVEGRACVNEIGGKNL